MYSTLKEHFKYDEITLALGCVILALHVAKRMQEPTCLVHPMLLGRQVDAADVRRPGESAVYRNFGIGHHSPLPTRPDRDIRTVLDFIRDDHTQSRLLWSTEITNAQLKEKVNALSTGFVRTVGLEPRDSNVLLLLDDCFEFLVTDLALASLSIPTLTITRLNILTQVIDTYPPSAIVVHLHFLNNALELVAENKEADVTLVVVGDQNRHSEEKGKKHGVKVVYWEDLIEIGSREDPVTGVQPPSSNDVFTVSFMNKENDQPQGTQLTHQNVTAGVTALKNIFPLAKPFTSSDAVLSSHSLSTPFGRSVAYTALFMGCSFNTLPSTGIFKPSGPSLAEVITASESQDLPTPTVLFVSNHHVEQMTNAIVNQAKQSWFCSYAWMQKTYQLNGGFLANDTIWDKLVFESARTRALGKLGSSLTRVFVTGPSILAESLTPSRIALSVPVVRAQIHPLSSGPILASHPLDLQNFSNEDPNSDDAFRGTAHYGPPAANVEVKLIGVNDDAVEKGADPMGMICVRGPTIGQLVPPPEEPTAEGWSKLGVQGKISTNGTFQVSEGRGL